MSEWKNIARRHGTATKTAERGAYVCGSASENRRDVDAAVERNIRSCTGPAFAKAQLTARATTHRQARRQGRSVDGGLQIGAGDSEPRLLLDAQCRPHERDLQRGGVAVVAHETIGEAM
jgi:hypothetical protein